MSEFKVEIRREHGEWYLSITRNGYQWLSMPLENVNQMRQIANTLLKEINRLGYPCCPECGNEDMAVISRSVFWCENCEKSFDGLGNEL